MIPKIQAIPYQILKQNQAHSIDVEIEGDPDHVSVYGIIDGGGYSYNNSKLNIQCCPRSIVNSEHITIEAGNHDGTYTLDVEYCVLPDSFMECLGNLSDALENMKLYVQQQSD